MGAKARALIECKMSETKVSRAMLEVYAKLLGEKVASD